MAHPLMTIAHPLTSVTNPLTTMAYPLTSVTQMLTSIRTIDPSTCISNPLTSIPHPLTSVTHPLTTPMITSTHPLKSDISFTTTALLTSPLSTVTYTLTTTNPTHTILDHQSSSDTLSSPTTQPNMSTTVIQEDSLTARDRGDDNDISSSADVKESPKSSGEGTLAAVLALRDQYSPSSANKQPAKPTVISLDQMWGGGGSKVQDQTDKGEADDITGHSEKAPVSITTSAKVLVATTSSTEDVKSPPPQAVTTPPTQSMDNTMGKYLQLLQQQQTEDKSLPSTHNTLQEEVGSVP